MTFKVGDVVELRSGGPSMTVSALGERGYLRCVHFLNGELKGVDLKPECMLMVKAA